MVFLDAEFTSLEAPNLLSIGMVSSEGCEHYVEIDLQTEAGRLRQGQSSDFVRENVLGMWGLVPGAACSSIEMGQRTADWLLGLAEQERLPLDIAHDWWVDFALLRGCIQEAGRWDSLVKVLRSLPVSGLKASGDGEIAATTCYEELRPRGLCPHHALADALALRAAYLVVAELRLGRRR